MYNRRSHRITYTVLSCALDPPSIDCRSTARQFLHREGTYGPRRSSAQGATSLPAVSVAQGQGQPEVLEWLGFAQLDSENLVDEAENLLSKKLADERPLSPSRPVSATLPVAIVQPECALEGQTEPTGTSAANVNLVDTVGYGNRAVPRRPWTREEAAALSVLQHPDSLTLSGTGARADAETVAVTTSMLEQRRVALEAERRRRQSGVSVDGVRVVKVTQRSYDNGVGYKSLLRPSERADGRPTWGLLEWPVDVINANAPEIIGSHRTTWGS